MSQLPPFNMFEFGGFSESLVREATLIFDNVIEHTKASLAERDSYFLTGNMYSGEVAAVLATLDELYEMVNFFDHQYAIYLESRNEQVSELLNSVEIIMEGYDEHYPKIHECKEAIIANIQDCRSLSGHAVAYHQLTSSLYEFYKDLMHKEFDKFTELFHSCLGRILTFHTGLRVRRHQQQIETRGYYEDQQVVFNAFLEGQDLANTISGMFADVQLQRQQLYQLRKQLFFGEPTSLKGNSFQLRKL